MRTWLGPVLLLSFASGCWRTAGDVQRDYAQRLRPAALGTADATPSETEFRPVRVMKVRVYADSDHRAQIRKWEERFREQVSRANQLLAPRFGISLEIESLRVWNRVGGGGELPGALDDLRAHDSATEVDWVVGLVSSLPLFSASLDQLGLAPYFGKHFVLRGMENLGEIDDINNALSAISEEERDALIRERRFHKETAVLLHEIGHTLGAFHERTWDWIMSPVYTRHQQSFSEPSASLMALGLDHRGADPERRTQWAKAWRAEVERNSDAPWSREVRDEAIALAAQILEGAPTQRPLRLASADRLRFEEALSLDLQGKFTEAHSVLSPLIEAHPVDPHVQSLACHIAQSRSPGSDAAILRCRLAAKYAPEEINNALLLGHALLQAKDTPGAIDVLSEVDKRMAVGRPAPEQTLYLAQLFREASSPALAEDVAARLPGDAGALEVLAWSTRARRWSGLGARGKLAADREHEVVLAMHEARKELQDAKLQRVESRQKHLARSFKDAPAGRILACELAGGRGVVQEIQRRCGQAVAEWDESVIAHFLLGRAAEPARKWDAAERHYRRAVELDSTWELSWISLAKVLVRRNRSAELSTLKQRFQAQFGREIAL